MNFKLNCVWYWKKNWFLVILFKMKFMVNLYIFYICLYKIMYVLIIVRLWLVILGGGGENILFFRWIFLEYIFFKLVINILKYIWWVWFIILIYCIFVYLCSLLISGCLLFLFDNFRYGLNGSYVNLNNILNIF